MTFDEFHEIASTRIPTAQEFVDFVRCMGWSIGFQDDNRPVLRIKGKADEFARGLARMLSREPWRSDVVAIIRNSAGDSGISEVGPCGGGRDLGISEVDRRKEPTTSEIPEWTAREWKWATGLLYTEKPGDASWGDEGMHPSAALWWRHAGGAWQRIPGREYAAAKAEREGI